jgi:hypothetical protein
MSKILSYRGREVTQADITFLKDVIAAHPDDSRRALSRRVCQAWNWTQPNGQLKDMVCRGLLLHLEREGHIIQPPPKRIIGQYRRKRPEPVEIDTAPINVPLKRVRPHLHFEQVRRTPDEKLFNSLVEQYHYLNYAQPVGEHLKYIVFCEQRSAACLPFHQLPLHLMSGIVSLVGLKSSGTTTVIYWPIIPAFLFCLGFR